MSLRKRRLLFSSTAAFALFLAACGGGGDSSESGDQSSGGESDSGADGEASSGVLEFPVEVTNEGESYEGEKTLRVALVQDSAFQGVFSNEFSQFATDSNLSSFMYGNIFGVDENYQLATGDEYGVAATEFSFDEETNIATIKIREGILWHGNDQVEPEELTVDDIVFSYEIVGHPEYTGVRYGENFKIVEGMEAYHNGEADTISGLEQVDDYTLNIHFTENPGPQIYQAGGTIWPYAAPRHYWQDVPITELDSSPEIREKPIGFGPFKVESITPGESVVYTANEDYFLGAPKIDGVLIERVPSSGLVSSLEAGDFDVTIGFPANQFPAIENGVPGYTTLGQLEGSYDYIGFKMGKWDAENGVNVYDPNAKMSNLNLRKAMGYALNIEAVSEEFYHGLRQRADSPIVPTFGDFYRDDLEGFPYDPEKAKELLDEAGYEDVDGDGFREDPNGEQLVITFAARAGSEAAEPIARYFIQEWNNIGLNVELLEGRLHESNTFYDRVQNDDPAIDVYEAGWSVGSDPTPDGLYGVDAEFNMPRFVDDKNTELIDNMTSEEALDLDYRLEQFHEWQEYFNNEAVPAIPTFWRTGLRLVNNRVSHWNDVQGAENIFNHLETIDLTAEAPVTE